MICPRCKSDKVNVVMDTAQTIKKAGCLWSLGRAILIICTLGLWLLVPRRVGHTKSKAVGLCQSCGYKFDV
jgi:predicted Zn-ribbon and HTH transcriptional regulator